MNVCLNGGSGTKPVERCLNAIITRELQEYM